MKTFITLILCTFLTCTLTFAQEETETKMRKVQKVEAEVETIKEEKKHAEKEMKDAKMEMMEKKHHAQSGAEKHESHAVDQKAGMEAFMESMKLGEAHEEMAKQIGTYSYQSKFWMEPGSSPMKSEGVTTIEPIMDGRYFKEEHKGSAMGMPFHGMAITGYDNITKKYVSSWIDNMGTGLMRFEGEKDEKGRLVMRSRATNAMTHQQENHKIVSTTTPKGWLMEYYITSEMEDEMKAMEITYTRIK